MASNTIPFTPPTFPPGYCYPASPQQLANDIVTFGGSVIFPSTAAGIIVSTTAPPSSSRNLIWAKVDANNNLIGTFAFSQQYNLWVSKHPLTPSDTANTADAGERRIYMGTLVGLQSYDGGDGGTNATIGDTTGPMWQQDTIWSQGSGATAIGMYPMGIPGNPQAHSLTNPGDVFNTANNTGGANYSGIVGCYFIKRTARLYYVGA